MSIRVISGKLKALLDKYDIEINCRTQYYSARSDAWQETEKGEEYLQNTERLREVLDHLRFSNIIMDDIDEEI
jgi:hypothetical protein